MWSGPKPVNRLHISTRQCLITLARETNYFHLLQTTSLGHPADHVFLGFAKITHATVVIAHLWLISHCHTPQPVQIEHDKLDLTSSKYMLRYRRVASDYSQKKINMLHADECQKHSNCQDIGAASFHLRHYYI
ncbi:MAG: hypothetical protein CMJ20_05270 [Phycisphaeraceae bacterium]|nr:hypothetical protein [Phycisphaeraceae bacterium]